jgi:copper chaperone NosL
MARIALFITVLAAFGCGQTAIKPVELSAGDMCSFCKMAISEKRYACELVNRFGDATKFDDIGCMKNYILKEHPEPSTIFVVDFSSKQWIDAKHAFYVHSSQLQTPMAGATAAFASQEDAQNAAKKYHGEIKRVW